MWLNSVRMEHRRGLGVYHAVLTALRKEPNTKLIEAWCDNEEEAASRVAIVQAHHDMGMRQTGAMG